MINTDLLRALERLLVTADSRAWSASLGWYFYDCPGCAGVYAQPPTRLCARHNAREVIERARVAAS